MSAHFTYEIDERKLRVKLQDLEIPYSNDAWQHFEAFAGTQAKHAGNNPMRDMQLPLNRNVIVPAVFGILIIFFSFLLFNFINIKNPAKADQNGGPEVTIPSAEVKTDLTPKIPVENTSTDTKASEGIKEPETTIQENKIMPVKNTPPAGTPALANKPVQQPAQQPQVLTKPAAQPVNQVANQGTETIAATPTTPVQQVSQNNLVPPPQQSAAAAAYNLKKKQKRRNVDIADADSTSSARPSIEPTDREAEARPN
jgi:hypothetical protein